MSDFSSLLLLACANCLGTSPSVTKTPANQCDRIQKNVSTTQPDAQPIPCISTPETIEVALESRKSQTLDFSTSSPSPVQPLLGVGSRGEAVTKLQTQLRRLRFYQGPVDGRYGSLTKAAVLEFQRGAKLNVDGLVGSSTWSALRSPAPKFNPPTTKASQLKTKEKSATKKLESSISVAPTPATPGSQNQPGSNTRLERPAPNSIHLRTQIFWPVGAVLFVSAAGGLVLILRNFESFSRQWQLQFQGESAASSSNWENLKGSREFEQPVILRQSPVWPQAVVWSIIGVTSFSLIWACTAKIDEAIPVEGKLEPQGSVKQVQAPVGGVVKEIHVEEGKRVEKGEILIGFDPTAARSKLESLQKIQKTLIQQNQYYRSQMQSAVPSEAEFSSSQFKSPELASLTDNRAALVAENQLYRVQLDGGVSSLNLSPQQQERLRASEAERNSRAADARLEVEQLSRQLSQTRVQLASARKTLATNQEIAASLGMLVKQGAYARLQYLKQRQDTNTSQAEVDRLIQEEKRLQFAIAQARERVQNTIATSKQDLFTKIADNEKQIAEIDSRLTKEIVENEKQLQEIDTQLSETQVTLNYQQLKAPVSGIVFDLQPHSPGYVYNSSEPILKIVPGDGLVAQIFITNQDIGFVKEGMSVNVRIDSFPYQEFGDIKGKLIRIGSDTLPPDQVHQFYRFPAEVRLEKQTITINGREIPLQSGMSLSANITVRKRTVISIFTDLFSDKVESLRFTR